MNMPLKSFLVINQTPGLIMFLFCRLRFPQSLFLRRKLRRSSSLRRKLRQRVSSTSRDQRFRPDSAVQDFELRTLAVSVSTIAWIA